MERFCAVPTGFDLDQDGIPCYKICGLAASYSVGMWFVCEGHKKHYTDPNRWEAISIKGEGEYDEAVDS